MFYYIDNFKRGVIGSYRRDSFSSPEFIRIDDSITHEYNPNDTAWSGLNSNFVLNYEVDWECYLNIKDNISEIQLSAINEAELYIDDMSIPLLSISSLNGYSTKTMKLDLVKNVYYFKLKYKHTKGGNGIEVKALIDDNLVDISKYLVYIPNGEFEYIYNTATYNVNDYIQVNSPIVYNDEIILANYSCESNLPNGLSIDNDGKISGKVTTPQDMKEYIIKAETNDGRNLTTSVFIKVIPDSTPSGFHFVDSKTGLEIDPLVFYLGFEYDLIIAPVTGIVLNIEFVQYPMGFEVDSDNHLIVNPTDPILLSPIIIKAQLVDTSFITFTYYVNVTSYCPDNQKYHKISSLNQWILPSGSIELTDKNGTTVFESDYISNDGAVVTIGCLIPDDYILTINFDSENYVGYNWNLYVDGKLLLTVRMENGQHKGNFNISTIAMKPEIHYEKTDITLYYDEKSVNIIPTFGKTIISSCSIEPDLQPDSLQFSTKDCSIKGYLSKVIDKQTYTVTATNAFGVTNVTINLTVSKLSYKEGCEYENKIFLMVDIDNLYKYILLKIYNPDDTTLYKYSTSDYSLNTHFEFCINQGRYVTYINSPYDTKSWENENIKLSLSDLPIGKYNLKEGESSKTFRHYCILLLLLFT